MVNSIVETQNETVRLTRLFDAPPDRIFRAWTDARQIERWFGPKGYSTRVVRLDLRVDGEYEFAMTPPGNEATTRTVVGCYREIVPNSRLAFTWAWRGQDDPEETLVTADFRASGAGTEIVLSHERLRTPEAREGHRRGWEGSFDCLAEYLA